MEEEVLGFHVPMGEPGTSPAAPAGAGSQKRKGNNGFLVLKGFVFKKGRCFYFFIDHGLYIVSVKWFCFFSNFTCRFVCSLFVHHGFFVL